MAALLLFAFSEPTADLPAPAQMLDIIWGEVITDLGFDYDAYFYVTHIGFAALTPEAYFSRRIRNKFWNAWDTSNPRSSSALALPRCMDIRVEESADIILASELDAHFESPIWLCPEAREQPDLTC